MSTVPLLLPKILRIRSTEIECEGDFGSLSQAIYLSNHWKFYPLRVNVKVISAILYLIGIPIAGKF